MTSHVRNVVLSYWQFQLSVLISLFQLARNKTSKLRIADPLWGDSPMTDPPPHTHTHTHTQRQRASNAESVSMSWRHRERSHSFICIYLYAPQLPNFQRATCTRIYRKSEKITEVSARPPLTGDINTNHRLWKWTAIEYSIRQLWGVSSCWKTDNLLILVSKGLKLTSYFLRIWS